MSKWWERVHPAWVGLLGALLYARTASYGFVRLDDPWLVRDNRLLHELTPGSLWHVLFDFSWEQRLRLGAEYLPVRDLSVMLDYAVFGDWVGGQHVVQTLLYAGTCSILATLTLQLFRGRGLAWLTGLLFATHPVHVEVVAWLSERKGALGSFLVCASLLAGAKYVQQGGARRAVAACALFLLAVGAKALTIAGIGALVLVMLWTPGGLGSRNRLGFLSAYAACGLSMFIPNVWVSSSLGVIVPQEGQGPFAALELFFQAHTKYLQLIAYQGPYAIDYGIAPGPSALVRWLPGALLGAVLVAILTWALVDRTRRGPATFGIGWWFVFLAPVSHLLVPVQNYAADRYLFLPSFGMSLAAAAVLTRLPRAVGSPIAVGVILLGLGWTIVQTPVWSSSDRLFENAVAVNPSNAEAWDKLAALAAERGDLEPAWSYTRDGLRHARGHWKLLHRQALLLAKQGNLDAAIETMREAASVPESHKAYANLGLLYLRRGEKDRALDAAREAVRLQSETAHNQRVLGVVQYERGDVGEACKAFRLASALDPFDADNVRNLELCPERTREKTP